MMPTRKSPLVDDDDGGVVLTPKRTMWASPASAYDNAVVSGRLALWDALIACLVDGCTPSAWMRERLLFAFADYQAGKCDDLADALGVKLTRRQKQVLREQQKQAFISARVDVVAAGEALDVRRVIDGKVELLGKVRYPKRKKVKASKKPKVVTAYDVVGREVRRSSARVASIYEGRPRVAKRK